MTIQESGWKTFKLHFENVSLTCGTDGTIFRIRKAGMIPISVNMDEEEEARAEWDVVFHLPAGVEAEIEELKTKAKENHSKGVAEGLAIAVEKLTEHLEELKTWKQLTGVAELVRSVYVRSVVR